jgi:hypothetical protein
MRELDKATRNLERMATLALNVSNQAVKSSEQLKKDIVKARKG